MATQTIIVFIIVSQIFNGSSLLVKTLKTLNYLQLYPLRKQFNSNTMLSGQIVAHLQWFGLYTSHWDSTDKEGVHFNRTGY